METADNKKVTKSPIKVAFDLTYYIIMTILVVALVTSVIFRINRKTEGKKTILGYSPTIVASGSMLPEIKVHAMCLIKSIGIDDVNVGDIIVYNNKERNILVIHRVIEINTDENNNRVLSMKGDNNDFVDSYFPMSDDVIGKVVYIGNWFSYFAGRVIKNGQIDNLQLILSCIEIIVLMYMVLLTISLLVNSLNNARQNNKIIKEESNNGLQSKQEQCGDSSDSISAE